MIAQNCAVVNDNYTWVRTIVLFSLNSTFEFALSCRSALSRNPQYNAKYNMVSPNTMLTIPRDPPPRLQWKNFNPSKHTSSGLSLCRFPLAASMYLSINHFVI